MEASDVRRLKELEDENARLKKMYANLSLKHVMLEETIAKSCESNSAPTLGRLFARTHASPARWQGSVAPAMGTCTGASTMKIQDIHGVFQAAHWARLCL